MVDQTNEIYGHKADQKKSQIKWKGIERQKLNIEWWQHPHCAETASTPSITTANAIQISPMPCSNQLHETPTIAPTTRLSMVCRFQSQANKM